VKILIADDDQISRRILAALVEREGHHVEVACDGASAWTRFLVGDIRLVITDWMMPGMDGIELLRRIRTHPGPYTYVILLTARSDREDFDASITAGVDDHLVKPVVKDDLRTRLRVAQRIVSLQEELARRADLLATANRRMELDLKAAQKAQRQLLPNPLPTVEGLNLAWRLIPCDELAGDTLNVIRLDERHLGFYVLDVSGHGVSAALMAVQVSRFLSPQMGYGSLLKRPQEGTPRYRLGRPDEIARELALLFHAPMGLQFFTLTYGLYDLATHSLELVCCAHPPPALLRADGTVEVPELSGHPIGLFGPQDVSFSIWRAELRPGDRLLLYSDGVTETTDAQGEVFGIQGLLAQLAAHPGLALEPTLDGVLACLATVRNGAVVADDISLLALERLP